MSSPLIFDVTEQDFDAQVVRASEGTPVMVDFWAEWCPPCRALTPRLERVIQACGGRVRLAKVEVDENMKLAGRYRLRGFPTVILFTGGAEVARFSGLQTEAFVHAFLAQHLPAIVTLREA